MEKIFFESKKGLFELTDEFTAFPGEDEVLVQDGLQYLIIDNIEKITDNTNKKYRLIQLAYPARI